MHQYIALVNLASRYPSFNIEKVHFEPLFKCLPQIEFRFVNELDELKANLNCAHFVIGWQFPQSYYNDAPNLKAVYTPAAGKELVHPDPRGQIPVFYGGFHGPMMFETLLAMQLYFNNSFDVTLNYQRKGQWVRNCQNNRGLFNQQTVMVIGFGDIGRYFVTRYHQLGLNVIVVRRQSYHSQSFGNKVRFITYSDIKKQLPDADHVVVILPDTQQTKGIITREYIQSMKNSAVLYNFGRGSAIKSDDLLWALEQRKIRGVGLDVVDKEPLEPEHPLWYYENALITPHSSCCYQDYAPMFIQELSARLASYI